MKAETSKKPPRGTTGRPPAPDIPPDVLEDTIRRHLRGTHFRITEIMREGRSIAVGPVRDAIIAELHGKGYRVAALARAFNRNESAINLSLVRQKKRLMEPDSSPYPMMLQQIPQDIVEAAIERCIEGTEVSYGEIIGTINEISVVRCREVLYHDLSERGFSQAAIARALFKDTDSISRALVRYRRRLSEQENGQQDATMRAPS